MAKDVIIACDFSGRKETLEFLDKFEGSSRKPFVKIGMELFYSEGPEIVREIKANPEVICCPHGRPIAIEITKNTIDHLFKRT